MKAASIDAILIIVATLLRLAAQFVPQWTGGEKLATELLATADEADAFRSTPVFKEEIERGRKKHTW